MKKNSRALSVISYITWIGWLVTFVLHDKKDRLVRQHLNQALVLNLIETVSGLLGRIRLLSRVCTVVDLACLVLLVIGVVRALKMSREPLPLIGGINLLG